MTNVNLTLGNVAFQDFEVPESIALGGVQRVAVQSLIGGGRVVNVLGGDDGEISFAGIFSGDDATARVQLLDTMRAAGAAVPLVWDGFFYSVVIAEVLADFTKPWWIPFSIRCVPLDDDNTDLADAVISALDSVGSDLAAATQLAGQAGLPPSVLSGTSSASLSTAQGVVEEAFSSSDAGVISSVGAFAAATDTTAAAGAFGNILATSAQLAALGVVNGYVNRAVANAGGELP